MIQKENSNGMEGGRWVHPLCSQLPVEPNGPFVNMPDGRLLAIDKGGIRISQDDGKTWSEIRQVCEKIDWNTSPACCYPLVTKNGVIVLVYLDLANLKVSWDAMRDEPGDDARLEIWSVRSLDNGQTWVDRQKLLGGYNANFFGFIQTRSGRLATAVEHVVPDPGRNVVCSLFSDDDGKSWRRSNFIDLGGHGSHDGALEPTVAELSDGRLVMFIRTNLDYFWQAFSDDGGKYWRTINRSVIDASSAPGYLLKLHSGRLVLAWNRLNPEGGTWPRDPHFYKGGSSLHREELSIAFSEDDARTWTKPAVICRQKGGVVCYPFVFERRAGELWIIATAYKKAWPNKDCTDPLPFRVKIHEEEFLAGK